MKREIKEEVEIPSGITCELANKTITCKKDSQSLSRDLNLSNIEVKVESNKIVFQSQKGNKNQFKIISSYVKHLLNMFRGLNEGFVYKLQSANVHFPMTIKVTGNQLEINNFLGEKLTRRATILPNVKVEVKGQEITVSSHDKEAAGHTVANIEKATKVRNRDRRIFQDGIFLIAKPGRDI